MTDDRNETLSLQAQRRKDRLAEELRRNLHRRKAQKRAAGAAPASSTDRRENAGSDAKHGDEED